MPPVFPTGAHLQPFWLQAAQSQHSCAKAAFDAAAAAAALRRRRRRSGPPLAAAASAPCFQGYVHTLSSGSLAKEDNDEFAINTAVPHTMGGHMYVLMPDPRNASFR